MKPGSKPYDRNSKEWQTMETVNPCNNFIVQFLVRSKIKVDKQGLNQYYCYNLAIESVKKYPLPIISVYQLDIIEGFGDFFKAETTKLIMKHYTRGRMPTAEEKKIDEAEQNQSLRLNIKKINTKKVEKRNRKAFQSEDEEQEENSNPQQSSRCDGTSTFSKNSKSNSKFSNSQSQFSASTREYKPKPGTQPYHILEIMKNLSAHEKPITKGEINQYLYEKSQQKMKLWHLTRSKLRDHGFIKVDDEDSDFLHLTKKAVLFLDNSGSAQQKKSKGNKEQDLQEENELMRGIKKEPIAPPANPKDLKIIINGKNFNQKQKETIQSHFNSLKSCKFEMEDYTVGDIVWEIEDQILEVVIKRLKMSEIDESTFRNACYMLKTSEAKQLIIILEQSESQCATQSDKIEDLIIKAKVTRIKIIKTKSFKDTLIIIQKYRKVLIDSLRNITNGTQMCCLGTLQAYNDRCRKKDPSILRNIFIASLREFPCIHIKTIQGIVERLPCFKTMYDKLSQLSSNGQRKEFLGWLLKNYKCKKGINRMLIDFLFLDNYEQQ